VLSLTERYADKIAGVLACFDRVVLTGTLVDIGYEGSATRWLKMQGIKIFDFPEHAKTWREEIRENAERLAAAAGIGVEFIRRAGSFRKEARVKAILRERGVETGLVCVFSAMETCPAYQPWHDKRSGETYLRRDTSRCLHYYFYFIDEEFGLCHLRVPTWAPYRLQFYFNGHNWLARRLEQEGIGYRLLDNCFVEIADWKRAQEIADGFDVKRLHRKLEEYAKLYCPAVAAFPSGHHWSLMQVEFATDIAFRKAADLAPIYDHIVRTAIHAVKAEHVASFLGRRLDPRYDGELGTDFHTRIEGTRIKHHMGRVALKMYDKHGRVLRIETVANDVSFFKHHREVEHRDGTTTTKLAEVRKTIYSMGVLARLMGSSNGRYLDFVSALDDPSAGDRNLKAPMQTVRDRNRSYRTLNFFNQVDLGLILAIARGEFRIRGFQVRDLRRHMPGFSGAQISRMIKRLRMHRLIRKIQRTYRYHLTALGARVIAAGLRTLEFGIIPALAGGAR
jgi:hypothetical protein